MIVEQIDAQPCPHGEPANGALGPVSADVVLGLDKGQYRLDQFRRGGLKKAEVRLVAICVVVGWQVHTALVAAAGVQQVSGVIENVLDGARLRRVRDGALNAPSLPGDSLDSGPNTGLYG